MRPWAKNLLRATTTNRERLACAGGTKLRSQLGVGLTSLRACSNRARSTDNDSHQRENSSIRFTRVQGHDSQRLCRVTLESTVGHKTKLVEAFFH